MQEQVPGLACHYETELVARLSGLTDCIAERVDELEAAVAGIPETADILEESALIRDAVLPRMQALRAPCDKAELLTAKTCWPFPTYGDILFSVK